MLKHTLPLVALCWVCIVSPCRAHAKLESSIPAGNAQLTVAPKTLMLKFNESAKLVVLKLATGGADIPVTVDKAAAASTSFELPLPVLLPGHYSVQWTAIAADDGHVTKGSFVFSIAG